MSDKPACNADQSLVQKDPTPLIPRLRIATPGPTGAVETAQQRKAFEDYDTRPCDTEPPDRQ